MCKIGSMSDLIRLFVNYNYNENEKKITQIQNKQTQAQTWTRIQQIYNVPEYDDAYMY